MSRLALQTAARAGSETLLKEYATSASLKLATYRARPVKLQGLPFAWVDSIREDADAFTVEESQRVVRIDIRIVWGVYDAGPTVDQRDRFVDGFYAWVMDHYHQFDGNAETNWVGTSDDEQWSPSWIPDDTNSYFSTLVTLEGRAST